MPCNLVNHHPLSKTWELKMRVHQSERRRDSSKYLTATSKFLFLLNYRYIIHWLNLFNFMIDNRDNFSLVEHKIRVHTRTRILASSIGEWSHNLVISFPMVAWVASCLEATQCISSLTSYKALERLIQPVMRNMNSLGAQTWKDLEKSNLPLSLVNCLQPPQILPKCLKIAISTIDKTEIKWCSQMRTGSTYQWTRLCLYLF